MTEGVAGLFRSTLTALSPKLHMSLVYRVKKHKKMPWDNPKTLPEKLLKLRLENYNKNPLVKQCADKYRVRAYVWEKGYGNLLNGIIAAYDRPEEIEWDKLPDRFALKINYACGYNIICTDKKSFDQEAAVRQLNQWLKEKPWLLHAELQYKGIPAKIIVEEYLEGKNGEFPEDYKLYCFHGKPEAILYMSGRNSGKMQVGFFDAEWNYLGKPDKDYQGFSENDMPKAPESLPVMLEAAAALSQEFPFVRMDFYDVDGKAIFGEMTFSPAGGFDVSEIEINGQPMGDLLWLDKTKDD